ncbi:type II secretion system F family protein [Xylophilus sp. ASV27]|uniref:type II secretion system F family protein n=1 Tax=Xylophilus sp. ASV27 TaxID=2795129 RepID=UPI0018EC9835|nr:type II secretion system F family protein [Xylophilus sp. ASV27]
MKRLTALAFKLRLTSAVRADFYGVLSSLTGSSGRIPLGTALVEMEAELRKQKHYLAPLLKEIVTRMRGGKRLSVRSGTEGVKSLKLGDALLGFMPVNEAMMIKAGEERGDVSMGLKQAARIAKSQADIQSIVRSGLFMVLLYAMVMVAIYYFYSAQIIPELERATPRAKWPRNAQVFAFVADHITAFSAALFGLLVLAWRLFIVANARLTGAVRDILDDHVWPFTMSRNMHCYAVLSGLSGFVKTGVPFQTAIDSMAGSSSRYMQHKFQIVRHSIKLGRPDYVSLLSSRLFPKDQAWIIQLYGKTSDFGESLEHIANGYIDNLLKRAKRLTDVISIVGVMCVAALVTWISSTLYSMQSAIR